MFNDIYHKIQEICCELGFCFGEKTRIEYFYEVVVLRAFVDWTFGQVFQHKYIPQTI